MTRWDLSLLLLGTGFLAQCVSSEEKEDGHKNSHSKGPAPGHWTYKDETGWRSEFPHCGGTAQSPINVDTGSTTFDPNLQPIQLSGYNVTASDTLRLRNNGHTVVLDLPGSMMIVGGLSQDYRAAQLHFHWGSSSSPGSEHTVNAQRFPGEIHVVHYSMEYESINDAKNQPGGLAVLAAFIQEGPELNPTYEQLLSHLREVEEEGKSIEIPGFDIHGLLPQRLDRYYRYNGSLTTPPCYQSVNWTLFNQTVSLSQEQLAVLENTVHSEHDHILQLNFREPQRLNGRHVLTSFKSPIGGRRGPGAAPDPAVVSPAPGDSTSHRSGQGAEGSGAHALSTGDMLAVIFGVLFGVTAVAFLVYVRKTRSRNQRLGSENKSVIYKAATTDENLA